ncbi:MAG TPA: hypothetical protein VI386_03280 [Candidatus Sulfotelmatobacter sp.]
MRSFDAHVRSCPHCSVDALPRVQMKRAIQVAGKRFTPSAEFRERIQLTFAAKPRRRFRLGWILAPVAAVILIAAGLTSAYLGNRAGRDRVSSEIADLHVATLASSSPVDVVSTDRHTVKPWFQGKIPFTFNLPELQNSEFTLIGGRMTYFEQAPGAQLIYDARKHHISVFIFQDQSLSTKLGKNSFSPTRFPFNMQTWSQDGLRYFVIGDANAQDIDSLVKIFKAAS